MLLLIILYIEEKSETRKNLWTSLQNLASGIKFDLGYLRAGLDIRIVKPKVDGLCTLSQRLNHLKGIRSLAMKCTKQSYDYFEK